MYIHVRKIYLYTYVCYIHGGDAGVAEMPLQWTKADGLGSELFGDEPQAVPRQSAVVMMPELSQCRAPPWRRWSLFLLVCLSCVFFLSCQQSALSNQGII